MIPLVDWCARAHCAVIRKWRITKALVVRTMRLASCAPLRNRRPTQPPGSWPRYRHGKEIM